MDNSIVWFRHVSYCESRSASTPGVTYRIRRMSFGRRLELARALGDQLEALDRAQLLPEGELRNAQVALLAAEIDAIHLRWGLESISGLEIDGAAATAESLLAAGPEELVAEILAAIRREAGLDEDERKNSAPPSISCGPEEPGRATRGSAEAACATSSICGATAGGFSPRSFAPTIPASCGDGGIPTTAPAASC